MGQNRAREERWKRPKWTRGFLWARGEPACTPSTTATETAPPLPSVPDSELRNSTALDTIAAYPQLFKIVTPINVNRFEELLELHANQPLVASVCRSLHEGVWPYANVDPEFPVTFDGSERALNDAGAAFARKQ
jgi:hypothetical protein